MNLFTFISALLSLLLISCTPPQYSQNRTHSYPSTYPVTTQSTAGTQLVKDEAFFTNGSTMNDVAEVMGTPRSISNVGSQVWWYYNWSVVKFRDGKVTEWDNRSNNLKVRWSESTSSNERPMVSNTRPPAQTQTARPEQRAISSPDAEKIDADVAAIIAGRHNPLPPAQRVQADPSAKVAELMTKNNTSHTLTVMYSGATSQRLILAPGASKRVILGIGMYKVAASVDAVSVIPFAGQDNIQGGKYENTFYIKTTIR